MKAVLCVIFLAALAQFSKADYLLALKVTSPNLQQGLLNVGHDVRGLYGSNPGFVLVISSQDTVKDFPANVLFSDGLNANDMVLVGITNDANVSAWVAAVQSCSQHASLFCLNDACVFRFENSAESALLNCLPSRTELVALPPSPVVIASESTPIKVAKNDFIAELVASVNVQSLTDFLNGLTSIHTRQSQSTGAVQASNFIQQVFTQNGWNTSRNAFRAGFSDNVIGEIRGAVDPNTVIIIGAHYDCRATNVNSATDRAPGANDDGSGTAMLLELSRILGNPAVKSPLTLRLIAFSGEEQGLYGSTAYALAQRQANVNIKAMIQGDMIAYQVNSNVYRLELGSVATTTALTQLLHEIAAQYVTDLQIGRTNGCCSDQQPFFNNGYPAALFVEAGGFVIDPQYHQVGDVVNRAGYSVELVKRISQAILAGAATLAGIGN